jgi:hypothetical protein
MNIRIIELKGTVKCSVKDNRDPVSKKLCILNIPKAMDDVYYNMYNE